VTSWALVAITYGTVLTFAALSKPIRRRAVALASVFAYVALAAGTGTLTELFWVHLIVPGGLLLAGYWLSGFFFHDPQPWLEAWLLNVDRAFGAPAWMTRLPRAGREVLEVGYASVYALVAGGAIYAATFGLTAVAYYWTLVLASELACYAPMPWLRSRPPRIIEPAPAVVAPPTYSRRLNSAVLDRASIQANTLPSGHVAGAVAAALGVMAVDWPVGWLMMGLAGVIAVAAIAGRYHYGVDCVAGAATALAFWSLM
jgi:hypothetical protein